MDRPTFVTSNSLYFTKDSPVFVNRVTESFRLEQHQHEFIEFSYVSEGKGFHYIEGTTLSVKKGDFFYLPIGVSHVFRPSTPEPSSGRLIVYNCLFNKAFAARLLLPFAEEHRISRLLETSFPEQPWVYLHDQNEQFQQIFDTLHEEFQLRRSDYLYVIQAEMIKLLVHMCRMQEEVEKPTPMQAYRRASDIALDRIAKRIQQKPAIPHDIKQSARETSISERHLRRLFKQRFSMTFTEYIHKCRIELSCRRLRETTDNISVIAQQAGYRDVKFYNSLFKKLTGMTPSAYRLSLRK